MKPRSERDKRYEEKHKNERKAKNVVWGTSIPRETAEEIDAFLKKHGYTKVKLIEEGYKSLLEQAGEIKPPMNCTKRCTRSSRKKSVSKNRMTLWKT